ncbi:efflux RND transporter periplasmic adaptor subunit [Sulfurimonas sp.]|uniref:efflux RND transporter periplasmic adaptor subunit n=1 Tax=Sulfurimonas sp. TaxID=2022749 RepID=UPI0019E3E308|nr:efflux RND transporter periplasmic adaptor subunit [Sulfurimonas sp.]MBE0514769.1 efflux RND transporter periplasmic adaptor subunit [Sulfurimonas sp.]
MHSLLSILSIAVLLFSGCTDDASQKEAKTEEKSTPSVLVANAQTHDFNASVSIAGSAKPNQQVQIYAMSDGYLKQTTVDIGDFVRGGDVVAVLDNPELLSQRAKLQAEFNGKKALYERLRNVYEKTPQLTSVFDVENAKAEFESLKAELSAVAVQIAYLSVKAPFSGVITQRFVDKGAIIQNALNNANSAALFEIQDIDPIRLNVHVPESDAPLIHKGMIANIVFPELPNQDFNAKVSRTSFGLNEATRTMEVQIDIANKEFTIRPGMYAKVNISINGHKDTLSVLNEALGNIKGESFVYVVENQKVRKVVVKTGIRDNKFTEIINGDIDAEDAVVVQGKEFCSDGASVDAKSLTNKKERPL